MKRSKIRLLFRILRTLYFPLMIKHITLAFFGLLSLASFSQDNSLFCEQLTALQSLVKNQHYKPKQINDSLSKAVFHLFLERLDSDKNFFLQSDIEDLKSDVLMLDNYITNGNCDFIDNYITRLESRINSAKAIFEQLKTTPLDYSGKLKLQFTPRSEYNYYTNEDKLKIGLSKLVAYRIISKLIDDYGDLDYIKANFDALELEVKPKVIQNEICRLEEIQNKNGGISNFAKEAFLNALVQYNDPNSTYFNHSEKIEFENSLSIDQLSFGIITNKNKDGDIVIAHIIPGSSAFKNGNLEVDDVLKSLTANAATLETLCVSNEDIIAFTNKEDNKTITFSVKKKNGTLQDITLTKSQIKVEDNAIRGYVIDGELPLGYIKIPSFYTNTESPNGRGLTSDIAKELYKLQKEKIAGLVIDLRFNGGGSMQEALDLSGMFIDRGPLSIIKMNNDETFTVRDSKRGSFFNKPIVILVNNYSASASEFFASAMQDYNRAIIVGSKTYGKASAQVIFPLSETSDLGFCKLTVEAFYRVTGRSHQSIGVVPEIILPSLYNDFESTEYSKSYALKNDTIAISIKHRPLTPLRLEGIKKSSQLRIKNSKHFQDIKANNKALIKRLFEKGERYPLTLDTVYNKLNDRKNFMDTVFNNLENNEQTPLVSIKNTTSTKEILGYNIEEKEQNDFIIEELSADIYIKEAQLILIDYLNTNN